MLQKNKSRPKTRLSPAAADDLDEAWQYLAEHNLRSADALTDELYGVCEMLAANPLAGRRRYDLMVDLRQFPHKNYNIFYFPTENGVEIYRVLHGSRDSVQIFEDISEQPN